MKSAHGIELPEAALGQHVAVLGKTGSGKTYAAKGLVEHLLGQDRQVCILDPTGAWYGLRLAADGKGRGYDVVLLGGKHGDLPLSERSGAAVARLVTEQGASVVIDTSGLHVGEYTRWFIDFAGTLYTTIRHPLHLVIDEAHYFMPQGRVPDPDAGRMLHAGNRLMSGGRSLGVRGMLITQRPAKLHKDSLSCADTLIAMRVIAPQDRGAVKDWIDGAGDPAQGKAVLDSLAQLQRGEGWVWYPEGGFLERVRFPRIRTYDSSATPTHGAKDGPQVTEIDLDEVRLALAEAVKEAEANDPKRLRARIAELERQAKQAPAPAVDLGAVARARAEARGAVRGALAPVLRDFERTLNDLGRRSEALALDVQSLRRGVGALQTLMESAPEAPEPRPEGAAAPTARREPPARAVRPPEARSNGSLKGPQQRILDALAMWSTLGVEEPTAAQVGFLARIKPTGGHFSNNAGPLSTGGLIEREGDGRMRLTDAGRRAARWPDRAASLREYHDNLREMLKTSASRRLLDAVIEAGMRRPTLTVEELGRSTGIDPAGGHFSNSIGPLSTLGLIERRAGTVRATDLLFPDGMV